MISFTRRQFIAVLAAGGAVMRAPLAFATGDVFLDIERRVKGRLGVAVLDTHTGRSWTHRGNERFAMCSTFKILACSAVLARVDSGRDDLERRIVYTNDDLVTYSPVTQDHREMSLGALCAAAMTHSDNTAANLVLKTLGGPRGVTRFARSIGDDMSRLDRWETALNSAIPGDARDTTTPMAMARNLRALTIGDVLSPGSRAQLVDWMMANTTGDARLRAGLPRGWRIGDKTGTGDRGTSNDVAIAWPDGRGPVIISVYLTGSPASPAERDAAIAAVGQAVRDMIPAVYNG